MEIAKGLNHSVDRAVEAGGVGGADGIRPKSLACSIPVSESISIVEIPADAVPDDVENLCA